VEHSFDIEIATTYGMLEATLLKNIYFWIQKNEANETNFYDGGYWTYNSVKAFEKLFPYASARKIANALTKLEKSGVIKTGNYNAISYDRTKWYALTKRGYSIMQKCKMEISETSNGNVENVEPIPDSKPDSKPDNNTKKEEPQKKSQNSYEKIIDTYTDDPELKETIIEFIKMRKLKKNPPTDNALELIFKKLDKLANNTLDKIEILEQSIVSGYQGVFKLKQDFQQNKPPNVNDAFNELASELGMKF